MKQAKNHLIEGYNSDRENVPVVWNPESNCWMDPEYHTPCDIWRSVAMVNGKCYPASAEDCQHMLDNLREGLWVLDHLPVPTIKPKTKGPKDLLADFMAEYHHPSREQVEADVKQRTKERSRLVKEIARLEALYPAV